MKRLLALLLVLLSLFGEALADPWSGTAEELAQALTGAGYPLRQMKAESAARVTFRGGAIEVFASAAEGEAALAETDASARLIDNVLLTREPAQVTSHYEAALEAILSGEDVPEYDAAAVRTEQAYETKVWIPIHGGVKYHAKATCSNMKDPDEVTVREAISKGFDACKRCKPVIPE